MVNRVILVGHLGGDPEMRYTSSGTPVTNFSLATNERWNNQDGERQERTEWHKIVTWSKLAEISNQYLTKGQLVFIEGRIQTREWDDKDGNKRRTTEIIASDMRMMSPRSSDGPRQEQKQEPVGVAAEGGKAEEAPMDAGVTEDDIPF
ncbi:MAG: single-stranded DNA-binding protein [Acidobacteria bacterium]|nr:single-stranded DNA-binding protein [Acidobacteriota bacterium]MCH8017383.1 single-stranded DNA-binding protein [Acidobacteriota bacterium]TDI11235.1 MAG: single-stranded DNA-binding protein [Acidobacteriota bacterium]TDI12253.1 MAG: single-stranded DNA-binding protein [Acidobacteriota bacterium]